MSEISRAVIAFARLTVQDISGWGENDRGVSYTFGGDVVHSFLQKHDLSLIARAHQVWYLPNGIYRFLTTILLVQRTR